MSEPRLSQVIIDLIRREGAITFARFMEMALYHNPGGYYVSSTQRIGPQGDFYTSPLAHPAFGALIAVQLEQMWEVMDAPGRFVVVEIGSGKGVLARDVVDYAHNLSSDFFNALDYITVDRTRPDGPANWQPITSEKLPLRKVTGCILSNELLDAMPVHRVMRKDGRLQEMYVDVENGELVDVMAEPSTSRLQERFESLRVKLEEGQEAEVNLLLEDWVRDVSSVLERGYALTFDYGYEATDLYSPKRLKGTLMCHYKHTVGHNPLTRVGEQDITAHVDLTSLMKLGQEYGLRPCGTVSQAQFLKNLGIGSLLKKLNAAGLSSADYNANRLGMQNLVDPEGMGNFQVVVQSKGSVPPGLDGLGPGGVSRIEALDLPSPLLADHHINLLAGRYPHLAWSPPQWDD